MRFALEAVQPVLASPLVPRPELTKRMRADL